MHITNPLTHSNLNLTMFRIPCPSHLVPRIYRIPGMKRRQPNFDTSPALQTTILLGYDTCLFRDFAVPLSLGNVLNGSIFPGVFTPFLPLRCIPPCWYDIRLEQQQRSPHNPCLLSYLHVNWAFIKHSRRIMSSTMQHPEMQPRADCRRHHDSWILRLSKINSFFFLH